ncbi:hypothetical protein N0V93_009567 [Gnomoniopsis smithogilvyi]|uniref:Uncharacterized protein n=1 Tax=Gnomoniopsis smithogilvyi TaxID=1191159 RepID=A0A9W9CTX5_9PEZI|nr:hypothetical protein N0V93_009567 [Gnomoniopsis smithogilvyi]
MASSVPPIISSAQAQDLQRQLESIISIGLRPDNVPIRRDEVLGPCVLDTPVNKKHSKKEGIESVAAKTRMSSAAKTVTASTSHGPNRRVTAWAAGVANASSASTSPEKSIAFETLLAANVSRWDAVLDQPVKLSNHPPHSSFALSGWTIAKRAVSPIQSENASTNLLATAEAGFVDATTSIINDVEGSDILYARVTSPTDTISPALEATTDRKTSDTQDTEDWLIDLSS